jgi:lipase
VTRPAGQLAAVCGPPTVIGVSDPFDAYRGVPVRGGVLHVARAGPAPESAAAVILAVHGLTGSHMTWRAVARELRKVDGLCLLAPDLRGRGRSAALPDPYGMDAHAADLLAVLDDAGVSSAVLAGHSMGAHVAARLAADHPERVSSVVLLDGGVAIPAPIGTWYDALESAAAPLHERLDVPVTSAAAYLARWRSHPAVEHAWNDDIEAYVRYEMTEDGCSVVSEEAVGIDCCELLLDVPTRTAVTRVRVPVRLLRASRGLFDDDHPVIPPASLDALIASCPKTLVEQVAGVNHYTLLLGDSPGPARTAAAIREAVLELGA